MAFQKKILQRSPEAMLRVPPNPCMAEGRKEAEAVMFGAIDELLEKTDVKPKDIGIFSIPPVLHPQHEAKHECMIITFLLSYSQINSMISISVLCAIILEFKAARDK